MQVQRTGQGAQRQPDKQTLGGRRRQGPRYP